mgnify:CR=1 FL=1
MIGRAPIWCLLIGPVRVDRRFGDYHRSQIIITYPRPALAAATRVERGKRCDRGRAYVSNHLSTVTGPVRLTLSARMLYVYRSSHNGTVHLGVSAIVHIP